MGLQTVYFVHISDTHIGPSRDYQRHGVRSYPCAQRMVEVIQSLPTRPDFVIHTGDVTTHPSPEAYQLAAELFQQLELPIYYVTGNHDRAADIRRYLPIGAKEDLTDDPNWLFYRFECKGFEFLVLDGRASDELDPHGLLPAFQLTYLRQKLPLSSQPLGLFLHFPIVPMNAPWMDKNMRLLNWQEVHQALMPARSRLRAVFHGHIHQNMQTLQDGLLYVSTASTFAQFTAWPADETVRFDAHHPPGYSFVHFAPTQTIIHQHTFPNPEM